MADMSTSKEQINNSGIPSESDKTGSINISNEVVSTVASLAASNVSGVSGMVSSISGGFAELLGKKNMSKGVKVSVNDKMVTLDLAIIVEYGSKVPDVAWEIQEKVKAEVEAMTGLSVAAVNVSVEGVNVPKDDEPLKKPIGDFGHETKEKFSDATKTEEKVNDAPDKSDEEFGGSDENLTDSEPSSSTETAENTSQDTIE